MTERLKPQEETISKPEPLNGSFVGKDFVSIEQITDPSEIEILFSIANEMKNRVGQKIMGTELANQTIAELFYQPSTRTFTSFLGASVWLGCSRMIPIQGMKDYSSTTKGESLRDTIRSIEQTTAADLIILRHPENSSSETAAHYASIPIINAGSGTKEHPTQAILDLYTIHQELGKVEGLNIVMLGDLKYGRTVKSLGKLLALVDPETQISFVSPELLKMPEEELRYLENRGLSIYETENLLEVLPEADVLYVTRLQKEWFEKANQLDEYEKLKNVYTITNETLTHAKDDMIVMHPLPRVNEIALEVDSDPRAAYFRQMRHGLYTRMALLVAILGETD